MAHDERFWDRVRSILTSARFAAIRHGHGVMGTEHLMLGILAEAPEIFPRLSVDPHEVRWRILDQMAAPDSERHPPNRLLPRSSRLDRALALAQAHAAQEGAPELRPEHLLLGVAEVEGSRGERTLRDLALDAERLRRLLGLAIVAEDDAKAAT